MNEMKIRGYHPDESWFDPLYRGQKCEAYLELKRLLRLCPYIQSIMNPILNPVEKI